MFILEQQPHTHKNVHTRTHARKYTHTHSLLSDLAVFSDFHSEVDEAVEHVVAQRVILLVLAAPSLAHDALVKLQLTPRLLLVLLPVQPRELLRGDEGGCHGNAGDNDTLLQA